MRSRSLAVLAALAALLAACSSGNSSASGGDSTSGSAAGATEITVFAASSLTAAFTQIGKDFEAANPGTTVNFNFGSSGDLAGQIESEGTADVFASASGTYMDDVSKKVGVTDRADFAQNKLVIIAPHDNPAHIESLTDLSKPGVQLVIAAAGVPVGDYARQMLDAANLSKSVLANVVSNEPDDASIVAKITSGEADAAIVYLSDVTSQVAPQVTSIPVPDAVNVTATYPIAEVDGSDHAAAAVAFVGYVAGAQGQATLQKFGFLPAPR